MLPKSLQLLARTRRFWTDFLWETETEENAYLGLEGCAVDLPVAGGFRLSLSLDPALCYFSLGFASPGQKTVEIAWDDQAQWHPHVLRWQELELVCRTIAVQDAELAHPGLVLLLLHRFAPICQGDDVDAIVAMLESAWRQLAVFSDSEIATFIERADARDASFRWRYHETVGGWCLEQDDRRAPRCLYTLRHPENAEFPFRLWAQMLMQAQQIMTRARGAAGDSARLFAERGDMAVVPEIVRSLRAGNHGSLADALGEAPPLARVCWIVESLLGLDAGSLLKRHVRPKHQPREQHSLNLTLPLGDSKRPLPEAAGRLIATTLDRILRDWNLGGAEVCGSTSTQGSDGSYVTTEETLSIQIKGDLKRGLHLLRDVLWWAGAPESVRLSRNWQEEIPLGLTQRPEEHDESCLQIGELRTVHWQFAGKECYRLDRVPFGEACRHELRTVLADARAEGPDEDGWFVVNLPDAGFIRLCLHRLDEDPDLHSGTVAVRRWSPEAAEFLYRLLQKGKLILLPMAIATSTTVAEIVTAQWPRVRVVESPSDLYDIVIRGPHESWLNQHSNAARTRPEPKGRTT